MQRAKFSKKGQDSAQAGDMSPVDAYRDLVSDSSSRFRADVEFHEQPRQIIFGLGLVAVVALIANANASRDASPWEAVKFAIIGGVVTLVMYCMLQSKDGLMLRPHPMVWRAVHGLSLCYFVILAVFVVLPPKLGISTLHSLFPEIHGGPEAVLIRQQSAPIPHLDASECAITAGNVMRQVTSIWFTAHVLGWWGKMFLIRDWQMCLTYSLAFEVAELSLVWMIPEFQECWWDSVFMDVLGANMIGMLLGRYTLKWLSCRHYEWEPHNTNRPVWTHVRHLLTRFTPFSWSQYRWPKDSASWWASSFIWISSLLLELNSFFIIHALTIRPAHWINAGRQALMVAQGAQSAPEWYEYVRGNTTRIGHNSWLMLVIIVLEMVLAIRYQKGGRPYTDSLPPMYTVVCLVSFFGLWSLWWGICTLRSRRGEHRSPNWLLILRFVAYIPLVFLGKNWVF